MIYVLRLYKVEAPNIPAFKKLFVEDGLWESVHGSLAGHIHTQLMLNSLRPGVFLSIEFWASEDHFAASHASPDVTALKLSVIALAKAQYSIGIFAFQSTTV